LRGHPPARRGGRALPLLLFLLAAALLTAPFDPRLPPWSWWPGWSGLVPPGVAALLALGAALHRRFRAHRESPWFRPFHLGTAFALGWSVKLLFPSWPLVPLAFVLLFPFSLILRPRKDLRGVTFTTFWVRPDILWFPLLALLLPALGRLAWPPGEPPAPVPWDLLLWAGGFFLWGLLVALAHGWWLYESWYRQAVEKHDRLWRDARELDGHVAREEPLSEVKKGVGKDAAMKAALMDEQDKLIYEVLKLGLRFFSARTGILLTHDERGFGVRAMASPEKGLSQRMRHAVLQVDEGLVRDAVKGGGLLVEGRTRRPPEEFPFYERGVQVGSFILRVLESGIPGRPWFGAVYLDSPEPDYFGEDEETRAQVEHIATAIRRIYDLTETMKKQFRSIERTDHLVLYARSLTETLDPDAIAFLAIQTLMQGAPSCQGAAVALVGEGRMWVSKADGILHPVERKGRDADLDPASRALAVVAARGGIPVFRSDRIDPKERYFLEGEGLSGVRSIYLHPSKMEPEKRGEVVGVMALARDLPGGVPEEAKSWAKAVANITAPALANAFTHREVERLSRTDPLTGLGNRRSFLEAVEKKIKKMERYAEEPFALLLMDLDHFKQVNDKHGHPAGDEVLREAARRVRLSLREFDAIGRYGGEEFIALLDRVKNEKDAEAIAEKLRKAVEKEAFSTAAGPIPCTLSLGFALFRPGEGMTLQELVDRADQALYRAKAAGRNRVVGFREGAARENRD